MLVVFLEETMMAPFMMSSVWPNLSQPLPPQEGPHVRERPQRGQREICTNLGSLYLVSTFDFAVLAVV